MDPATTLLLLETLVKYGPGVTRDIIAIFHKADPTPEDWINLLNKIDTPLHQTSK